MFECLKIDEEFEREAKCESFKVYFGKYTELTKMLKNEMLLHQAYIPKPIFEECREDVERIIEALLNKNQDSYSLCEKVLKKEHLAHWDTFAEFLPQRKEAKDLWKYLLIYNRITASWENCIAYYEAFEMIDDILCSCVKYKCGLETK